MQAERAVKHRRGIQRAVKDVREKITSSSGLKRSFEFELARMFARNHVSAGPALLVFTFIMAAATLTWASPVRACLWLVGAQVVLILQYILCRRFLIAEEDETSLKLWIKRMILREILLVFTWALLPFVVGIPETEGTRLFLLFAVLVVGAVAAVLSYPLPSASKFSVVPIGVAITQLAFYQLPSERWMIIGLSIAALLLFALLAGRLYSTTLDSLNAQAARDDAFAEVEQANMRLQEATKRAEDGNAAKSRFLTTMSHELRTPLNAILGFAEMIKGETFGPVGNEKYKSYIEDIHSSGVHLLNLINEVLDLSRIEAGKHELSEEAIDLVATVDACCHMLELRASTRGLKLRTAFTDSMARLWADERAIRQVTLNLLSNAIKFTPQGAEIVVKVGWTASGGQYISVKDNGPGIPEAELSIVLSTFGRGSQAIKNADQGSGLGLPIVKSLVELHGGAFRLMSKIREGTEAIAMFPPSRVMSPLAAVEPRVPDVVIIKNPSSNRAA